MVSSSLLIGIKVTLRFESSVMNIFKKVVVAKRNLCQPQKFFAEVRIYFFMGSVVLSNAIVYHLGIPS